MSCCRMRRKGSTVVSCPLNSLILGVCWPAAAAIIWSASCSSTDREERSDVQGCCKTVIVARAVCTALSAQVHAGSEAPLSGMHAEWQPYKSLLEDCPHSHGACSRRGPGGRQTSLGEALLVGMAHLGNEMAQAELQHGSGIRLMSMWRGGPRHPAGRLNIDRMQQLRRQP